MILVAPSPQNPPSSHLRVGQGDGATHPLFGPIGELCAKCGNPLGVHFEGKCQLCPCAPDVEPFVNWNGEVRWRKVSKLCPGCTRILVSGEFYPEVGRHRPDGLKRVCKSCFARQMKSLREREPARMKLATRLRSLRYKLKKDYEIKGEFTLDQVVAIWESQDHKCFYCEVEIKIDEISLDHKTPLNREGTHSFLNLAASCGPCNFTKGDKTEHEFREWLKEEGALANTQGR